MDILTDKPRAHKAALSSKELHNVCNWGLNYMETLGNEFEDISLCVYLWYEPAFAVLFYTGW